MKTTTLPKWTAVGASLLTAIAVMSASAGQHTEGKKDSTFTGTVTSVDPEQRSFAVQGLVFKKRFSAADKCSYSMMDSKAQSISGLRLGQKVTVDYENHQGVRIADCVTQLPMRFEGKVNAIDPIAHTVTVRHKALDKTFQVGSDCKVKLYGDKSGSLTDLKLGQLIVVTYESPREWLMAREISQTSTTFTGSLTAIDLNERTLKAKHALSSKRFNLADNCSIEINGKTDGRMVDLRPGQTVTFCYTEVKGVNVANRILIGEEQGEALTASNVR